VFPSVGARLGGPRSHVWTRNLVRAKTEDRHGTISELTLGVQLGGQTFSELLFFPTKETVDQLKHGEVAFTANASAVIVKGGRIWHQRTSEASGPCVLSGRPCSSRSPSAGQKLSCKPG